MNGGVGLAGTEGAARVGIRLEVFKGWGWMGCDLSWWY